MNRIPPSGFIFVSTHSAEPPELIPVRHIVRVIPRGDSALLVLSNDDRVPVVESLAVISERVEQTTRPQCVLDAPPSYPWTPVTPMTAMTAEKPRYAEAPHEDLMQPMRKTRVPPTSCARQLSTEGPCFIDVTWRRRLGPFLSVAEACSASVSGLSVHADDCTMVRVVDANNEFLRTHPANRL